MPVIDILSEDTNSLIDTGITLIANSSAFRNITPSEQTGQLYAYYFSNSTVVLGTRSAMYTAGNDTLPIVVGISSVADGMYRCEVKNFVVTNAETITITSVESELCIKMI